MKNDKSCPPGAEGAFRKETAMMATEPGAMADEQSDRVETATSLEPETVISAENGESHPGDELREDAPDPGPDSAELPDEREEAALSDGPGTVEPGTDEAEMDEAEMAESETEIAETDDAGSAGVEDDASESNEPGAGEEETVPECLAESLVSETVDPADPSLPWFDHEIWEHNSCDDDSVRVVGVRFYPEIIQRFVDPGVFDLRVGDEVVVALDDGEAVGVVVRSPYRLPFEKVAMAHSMPLPRIIRWAEDEDIMAQVQLEQNDLQALSVAREKAREHGLEMKFLTARFHKNEPKLTYEFTAENRVDFRDLVRDLASIFHQRIELRQVGVRDHVSRMGGIGPCGREFCCASFLDEFSPITIRMAKDQDLSMNPNNISGSCGRLMCCLQYEHEAYLEAQKLMPRVGRTVSTIYGRAKVRSVNLLLGELTVELFDQGGDEEAITIHLSELTDRDAVPNAGMPRMHCPRAEADGDASQCRQRMKRREERLPSRGDAGDTNDETAYDFSELGGRSKDELEQWKKETEDAGDKPESRNGRRRDKARKGRNPRRSRSRKSRKARASKKRRNSAVPRKRQRDS